MKPYLGKRIKRLQMTQRFQDISGFQTFYRFQLFQSQEIKFRESQFVKYENLRPLNWTED